MRQVSFFFFKFLLFLTPLVADHFLLPHVFIIHVFINSKGERDTLSHLLRAGGGTAPLTLQWSHSLELGILALCPWVSVISLGRGRARVLGLSPVFSRGCCPWKSETFCAPLCPPESFQLASKGSPTSCPSGCPHLCGPLRPLSGKARWKGLDCSRKLSI